VAIIILSIINQKNHYVKQNQSKKINLKYALVPALVTRIVIPSKSNCTGERK
jgi:hypothetical protein